MIQAMPIEQHYIKKPTVQNSTMVKKGINQSNTGMLLSTNAYPEQIRVQ